MNERIRELAEQVFDTAEFDEAEETLICERFAPHFAELIIKECIYAVECTNDRHRRDYFAAKIREHFGIK